MRDRGRRRIIRRSGRTDRTASSGQRHFRKRSGQFRRRRGRNFESNRDTRQPYRGSKRISRKGNNRRSNDKTHKKITKDKDDLDRQMREYWIKKGSNKGGQGATKDHNLASQKMNEEMDDYWKKAKQKKQHAQEPKAQEAA